MYWKKWVTINYVEHKLSRIFDDTSNILHSTLNNTDDLYDLGEFDDFDEFYQRIIDGNNLCFDREMEQLRDLGFEIHRDYQLRPRKSLDEDKILHREPTVVQAPMGASFFKAFHEQCIICDIIHEHPLDKRMEIAFAFLAIDKPHIWHRGELPTG